MQPLIVIVGPTGVGKTKLSVELAKRCNAEIINADSMQVYRGLDIGTAKIKEEEKEGIPHHLFDIVDVTTCYTVYDYQKDCRQKIEEITQRGKRVILVGGTGLYLKAALFQYEFQDGVKDDLFLEFTNQELLEKIKQYDPACKIHENNRRRLVRTLNKYQNQEPKAIHGNCPLYPFLMIGLTTSREVLYDKIDRRVEKMIEEGLEREVFSFYQQNLHTKALQTGIGYKEFYHYFDGTMSKEEVISLIQKNSRHYAKRQYTFFRHQFDVTWFQTNYDDFNQTIKEVEQFIQKENIS